MRSPHPVKFSVLRGDHLLEMGLHHPERLALGGHDGGTTESRFSMETAVMCLGRNRPHWSKGRGLAVPRLRCS
jgi:hypothetical protein